VPRGVTVGGQVGTSQACLASRMWGCSLSWLRTLNPNVRYRLLYDFCIYAGAGMWAR